MTGPLSLHQIAAAMKNGPQISAMENDIAALRRMMQNNPSLSNASSFYGDGDAQNSFQFICQYKYSDGKD
jgi:hypothetical protein